MEQRECPLCQKRILFGRVYLLFENGDLWLVDAALGHLADCHNIPIPCGLANDVLGQQLFSDRVPRAVIQQPTVELPLILCEGEKRTVRTGFSNRWNVLVENAQMKQYGNQLFLTQ